MTDLQELTERVRMLESRLAQQTQALPRTQPIIFSGQSLRIYRGGRAGLNFWKLSSDASGNLSLASYVDDGAEGSELAWTLNLAPDPRSTFDANWDEVLSLVEIDVCDDGDAKKAVTIMSAPYTASA